MFRRPWSIRMHEGEFERKGCGNMKRYKVVFLFAMVASWMMIGEANDAVQTAAKTALRDVNGTSLGKLYKVRKQAETAERKEIVVKACVAGLYAIGDLKNARKIGEGLDVDELLDSFMSECDLCRGEGCSSRKCYKCKGAGTCQNSGCHDGRVIVQGFNGNHTERACSICRGTGHCPKCKGEGKLTETCRRCGGTKRSINKGKALGSCKELLKSLTVSEKEKRDRERAEEEARLARERAEEEKRKREAREEAERRERREAEYKAREEAERAQREKERAEKKAQQEKEREERAEQNRREFEELEKTVSALPKSTVGWIRDVNDTGVFVDRIFDGGKFLPIQIRVFSDGLCFYSQVTRDGNKECIVFGDIWNESGPDRRSAYNSYIALVTAAKKAKEWRNIAFQQHTTEFYKEIPVLDTRVMVCSTGGEGRPVRTSGKVRYSFTVKTVKGEVIYALQITHSGNSIFLDLRCIDEFLRVANPSGAFEFLQKYDNLYN